LLSLSLAAAGRPVVNARRARHWNFGGEHQRFRAVSSQKVEIGPENNQLGPLDSQDRAGFPKGTVTQEHLRADGERRPVAGH
jgi:hypothetical protein